MSTSNPNPAASRLPEQSEAEWTVEKYTGCFFALKQGSKVIFTSEDKGLLTIFESNHNTALAALQRENAEQAKQIKLHCLDWAEDDTAIKNIAKRFGIDIEGDGYAFKSAVEVVEELGQRLDTAEEALSKIMSYGSRSVIKPMDRSEMCMIAEASLAPAKSSDSLRATEQQDLGEKH